MYLFCSAYERKIE